MRQQHPEDNIAEVREKYVSSDAASSDLHPSMGNQLVDPTQHLLHLVPTSITDLDVDHFIEARLAAPAQQSIEQLRLMLVADFADHFAATKGA